MLEDSPPDLPRDLDAIREAYLDFATELDHGLDVRVVTSVARSHWGDTGLDDERLAGRLELYKRLVLERLGVPPQSAQTVNLADGSMS